VGFSEPLQIFLRTMVGAKLFSMPLRPTPIWASLGVVGGPPTRGKELLALSALLIALAGCGASDEERVTATIKRFNQAAAEGDGKKACEQLTPAARATGGLRCEAVIDQLGRLGGEAAKRRLAAVEVRNVRVNGNTATAEAQIPTQNPTTLQLEKIPYRALKWLDGEWKVAALGAGPGGGF
jgi:hypothetical protein